VCRMDGIPTPLFLGLPNVSTNISIISTATPASNAKLPWPAGPVIWLPAGYTMTKTVLGDVISLVREIGFSHAASPLNHFGIPTHQTRT